MDASGDDEVIVADAAAAVGDHGIGVGVELGDHLLHPLDATGLEIAVAVDDLVNRPYASGDQGVARLVVVNFLAVDNGDAGAVQFAGEAVRHGDASQAAAGDHDACAGLDARTRFLCGDGQAQARHNRQGRGAE